MAFYPKISGNNQSKLNLASFADTNFDIYVFEESDGVQKAFMIFILKNTTTTTGQNLVVSQIVGNSDFNNNGFALNNLNEDSQTIPHLGLNGSSNNKIKAISTSGMLATNTGVTVAQMNSEASGAVGAIGIKSSITDADGANGITNNGSELNASNCSNVIPIYKSTDIGSTQPLPPNSYCAIIVKYAPTSSINASDFSPELTITNSHATQIINFSANAVNTLTMQLHTGTATDQSPNDDTFTTDANVVTHNDGGNVVNLGFHPVGHLTGSTNQTIRIKDVSSEFTSYEIQGTNPFDSTLDGSSINVDGSSHGSWGYADVLLRFSNSLYHKGHIHSGADLMANKLETQPAFDNTTEIFKNFSLRTVEDVGDGHINSRPTHYNTAASNVDPYVDYETVSGSAAGLFQVYFSVGKILNQDYPQETADGTNNQYFTYGVTSGYYHKLTMSSEQILIHKQSTGTGYDFKYRYLNIEADPSGTDGPFLQSKSGSLFRKGRLNLGVLFRYNNFNGSTESAYTIPEFAFNTTNDNSLALYSNHQENNAFAVAYGTTNSFNQYGSSVTTDTTGVNFNNFSSGTGNQFLQLKYELVIDDYAKDNLYAGYTDKYNKISDSGEFIPTHYGVVSAVYRPAYMSYNTIWRQGLGQYNIPVDDNSHGIKYRIGFQPIPSTLEIVANDETLNQNGVSSKFYSQLFSDGNHTGNYNVPTTKVANTTWYAHNSTTASDANVKNKSYSSDSNILNEEGDWYGDSGFSVNQPKCWVSGSSSRRYTEDSGTGFYIKHNPVIKYIKTGQSDFYEESKQVGDFYFKLEDASFHDSVSKFRSVGQLFMKNTGDYPIYIQNISIGHANLPIDGAGNTYMSQGASKMLFPTTNTTVKPDASNSNDPTWKISMVAGTWDDFNDNAATNLKFPNNVNGSPNGFTHYWTNQDAAQTDASSAVAGKIRLIDTMWDEEEFDNQASFGSSSDETVHNSFKIGFELDPTNNSSHDQGAYYAQILVSYYVGDRYNEKIDVEDNDILYSTDAILSSNSNYQSRLNVSKYLVKVNVQPVGVLSITDIENDELAGNDITIPNIVIG